MLEGWLGIISLFIAFAALYLTLDGIQIASDQRDQDRQWRTEDAESRRLNSLALAQQLLNDQRNPNAHPGALALLLGSASHRELNGIALPNLNFERAKLIAQAGSIEHFRRANFQISASQISAALRLMVLIFRLAFSPRESLLAHQSAMLVLSKRFWHMPTSLSPDWIMLTSQTQIWSEPASLPPAS